MRKVIYLGLVLLAACSKPQQSGLVYFNDYESIKGWAQMDLSKEQAHSGVYSNKLDSVSKYGLTFKMPFAEISNEKIRMVKVSAWVFITAESKGGIVLEVLNHDGKQILWAAQKTDITNVVPDKWQLVSKEFVLNDSINKPTNSIAVYPWCSGKTGFYVDDLRIEFVTKAN
jgi:hypothetical protein